LKRHVAVKTIRHDLNAIVSSDLLDRFQREAEAMAQLSHPNIMPIYAVGEGEGIAYFIMPLARGKPLSQKLGGSEGLPIGEARRFTLEIAQALHHAHQAGVIHRDVKPDNIMLDGDEERVLVTDFGIAKAAVASSAELTGTGIAIGTPAYMSPEQAAGDPDIDHRADIYSLGVVAFQMLTGRLPFSAPTVIGMIAKQAAEDAPKVLSLRPNCPRVFAEAVDCCLAKEPAERFESAAELRSALGMSGKGPAESEPKTEPVPEVGPVKRFRRTLIGLAIANIVLFPVDMLMNRALDFSPVIAIMSALVVASGYARMWLSGWSWQDVLGRGTLGATSSRGRLDVSNAARVSSDSAELTDTLLAAARSERANVVRLLAGVPHAEERFVADVVPAVDEILAKMSAEVQRIERLEAALSEREEAVAATSLLGARSAPDERAIDRLSGERARLFATLQSNLTAVQGLRELIEDALAVGGAEASAKLTAALETLNGRTDRT
jgi:hypothetical protein